MTCSARIFQASASRTRSKRFLTVSVKRSERYDWEKVTAARASPVSSVSMPETVTLITVGHEFVSVGQLVEPIAERVESAS